MQEERFMLLAGLYLSGEASSAEKEELDQILLLHPEWEPRLAALRRIWQSRQKGLTGKEDAYRLHLLRLGASFDADPVLEESEPMADPATAPGPSGPAPATGRFRRLRIAAAAACLGAASFFVYQFISRHNNALPLARTVTTNPGSRSRLTLPDGTTVFLNADSRLTYNENFSGDTREVRLSGEAFFDVAKDAGRPFLIHTEIIDIKVLGTSFNVRSYNDERITETDLLQGSVEVTLHNKPDKRIILKPNEKLTVHNDQVNVRSGQPALSDNTDATLMTVAKVHFQKKDSSVTEILWTRDQLAFDNSSLENVALQLQRWYGVTVIIRDEKLKNIRLNAVFGQESLQQVMEALGIAGNFTYVIRKNEVIISP